MKNIFILYNYVSILALFFLIDLALRKREHLKH